MATKYISTTFAISIVLTQNLERMPPLNYKNILSYYDGKKEMHKWERKLSPFWKLVLKLNFLAIDIRNKQFIRRNLQSNDPWQRVDRVKENL